MIQICRGAERDAESRFGGRGIESGSARVLRVLLLELLVENPGCGAYDEGGRQREHGWSRSEQAKRRMWAVRDAIRMVEGSS